MDKPDARWFIKLLTSLLLALALIGAAESWFVRGDTAGALLTLPFTFGLVCLFRYGARYCESPARYEDVPASP